LIPGKYIFIDKIPFKYQEGYTVKAVKLESYDHLDLYAMIGDQTAYIDPNTQETRYKVSMYKLDKNYTTSLIRY
jgi:hypothetical protein